MGRPGKKRAKRLAARIADWEKTGSPVDSKNRSSNPSGFYIRKPGSNKR